ncbi:MAG: hypothetical protein LBM70_08615, partial [Victivallales bacterium]|nr:hypothetical protein [Victivallales bacterium]
MMKSVLPILSGVFSFGILFLNAGETVSKNSEKNNSNTTGTVVATEIPESSSEAVEQTINITTLDGKVYKDATIERITPSGIDIGYVRDDGSYAMIGLPLANLSSDLQKAFNYDPQKAKAFDAKIEKLKNKSLEDTAENEATRMARIAEEIKAKLAGGDVKIKPADLRFAIYARRRPVVIIPVEQVQSGTVVALVDDNSNLPTLPTLILIDKLKLSEKSGK